MLGVVLTGKVEIPSKLQMLGNLLCAAWRVVEFTASMLWSVLIESPVHPLQLFALSCICETH